MDSLIQAGLSQGLGYGLFVFLLVYVLKTSGEREKKYQDIIEKLTDNLDIVEDVQKDVEEIKNHLRR